MDNWKLIFADGTELTEKEAGFWDNVPNKEIKQASFVLLNGSKLIFDKFNSICIAKTGMSMINGISAHTGYRITVVEGDTYKDFIITSDATKRNTGIVSELTISKECFRRGI